MINTCVTVWRLALDFHPNHQTDDNQSISPKQEGKFDSKNNFLNLFVLVFRQFPVLQVNPNPIHDHIGQQSETKPDDGDDGHGEQGE